MGVPLEIPERLRTCGVPVEPDSEDELAWPAEDALQVIDALGGTKVAVLEINIYRSEAWGFVPTDSGWSCELTLGETASEFATRSQQGAGEFIRAETGEPAGKAFYALVFSDQQDAA